MVLATHTQTRIPLVEGFAAYLAQGCGFSHVAIDSVESPPEVAQIPHDLRFPWMVQRAGGLSFERARSSVTTDAVRLALLNLDSSSEADGVVGRVRNLLEQTPVIVLAGERSSSADGARKALVRVLHDHALEPALIGSVDEGTSASHQRGVAVAVIERVARIPVQPPVDFRVLAIVPTFNEADIIEQTLAYLVDQGLEVYLLDNWSTDRTVERAMAWLGRGLVAIERFPESGANTTYDLRRILGRVEEVATEVAADWYVLHDADERRCSPWPELGLREAFWRVDQRGFTCIDHVTVNFWPTDAADAFDERIDVQDQLVYGEFSTHAGHFHQRRAWKNPGMRVSLAAAAGHDVAFAGRQVEPFKFLLKHFPVRSRAHGERKVLRERLPRFSGTERAMGWHAQYDDVDRQRFVRDPAELQRLEPEALARRFVIQRSSGLGVFDEPPWWATPMRSGPVER